MTIDEYLERGFPADTLAECLEKEIRDLPSHIKIACCNRAELEYVLDFIQVHIEGLSIGFDRSYFTAEKYPHWYYFYQYNNEVHIGGGDADTVPLSEILEDIIDDFNYDLDWADLDDEELDLLFN